MKALGCFMRASERSSSTSADSRVTNSGAPVAADRTSAWQALRHHRSDLAGIDLGSWFDPAYASERVPLLIDVLEAAGLTEEATSVDVISLDGYMTTFSIEQLRRS